MKRPDDTVAFITPWKEYANELEQQLATLQQENEGMRDALETIAARDPMKATIGGAETIARKALKEVGDDTTT